MVWTEALDASGLELQARFVPKFLHKAIFQVELFASRKFKTDHAQKWRGRKVNDIHGLSGCKKAEGGGLFFQNFVTLTDHCVDCVACLQT